MGKPTGFLEYERGLPPDIPPAERLKDWGEFHTHFDEADLRLQCARCMNCGVPFCHTGGELSGGLVGCPLGNLIPEWNDLVYRGNLEEAYRRLTLTNPFPEFTGRVCPAPCEGACTVGLSLPAVAIRNTEAHIIDSLFEKGLVEPVTPAPSTGKTVAVVGSGPAGLACAHALNRMGHKVTVFERADRAGGLLLYGIPNMKLDKKVVARRVELLERAGVEFILGCAIGEDKAPETLLEEFHAVVYCCGAAKPRPLAVPGAESSHVRFAVEYLTAATKALLNGTETTLSAKDRHVIVVGGGDTGTDCVATALRQGCKSVTQLEIMPALPEDRPAATPWPLYPRTLKVDYGQEEAIYLQGQDPRVYETTVTKVTKGKVHTVQVNWERTETGLKPMPIMGSEKILPADLILVAMGFTGPEDTLKDYILQTRRSGGERLAGTDFATGIPGVFAAGDMRRGQSLVVWAIKEGLDAAKACGRYLRHL